MTDRTLVVPSYRPRHQLVGLAAALLAAISVPLLVGQLPRLVAALPDLAQLDRKGALLLGVIFAAAAVSSTIGFAFSAFAGAVIFHVEPNPLRAVEIMMFASIGVQITCLAMLWRKIDWSQCVNYIAGGIAVLPFGLLLVLRLGAKGLVCWLGVLLVAYGLIMLARPRRWAGADGPKIQMAVGALGGLTGPLAAFPGAFVGIWCGVRGFDKIVTRSIMQPYLLVMQLAAIAAMTTAGVSTVRLDAGVLLYVLPGLAGASLGTMVFSGLTDARYQRLVVLGLIGSGLALVLK